MVHVAKSVTIKCSRQEVYDFWRGFERFPEFMIHLVSVTTRPDGRSHWVVKAPVGQVEWDSEVTEDRPCDVIAWESTAGSQLPNGGSVRFSDAPADRGTEVRVALHYDPPGGSAGTMLATLFGEEPSQQLEDDLRRFKQVMETGEVVRSEGSVEGAGEGASAERPAQAVASGGRS
jgi:uncharacterized membrane protein